jgi:hypothetical protein
MGSKDSVARKKEKPYWWATDDKPVNQKTQMAYDALKSKQLSYDNLMWQTPLLCVTAQSFLFSVALTSANSLNAKIVSALLTIILGFAAIQLMAKHRHHEILTSKKLDIIEEEYDLVNVHAKPKEVEGFFCFIVKISSFKIWIIALTIMTSVGLGLFINYLRIWIYKCCC